MFSAFVKNLEENKSVMNILNFIFRYCLTCKKEQPTTQQANLQCLPNRLITYLEEPLAENEIILVDNLTG